MPKITEEQKKRFLELYKKGFRGEFIANQIGMNRRYARRIVNSFDSGDYSWLESGFRNFDCTLTESGKVEIVKAISESETTWAEIVAEYGIPENTLKMWKRNYNEYGVCSRKRGRPGKDGSHDKRSEENQIATRRDYHLQNVLPGLRGKRDGS